jgi:uncharacterized protein (DUF1499 family)
MIAAYSAHIAAALFVLSLALMLAAPLGYRLRLCSAATALTKVVALGLVLAALAMVCAIVSLATGGWQVGPGTTIMLGAIVLIGGVAVLLPLRAKAIAEKAPIRDITTDIGNPPPLQALLPLRQAEGADGAYPGAATAAIQHANYPDLAPLRLQMPPAQAFARALITATAMGWRVVDDDAAAGRIEAYDKTLWFGFTDDVVIRLAPEAGGTRVDLRSVSRVGVSDLGANAKRIRAYMDKLKRPTR